MCFWKLKVGKRVSTKVPPIEVVGVDDFAEVRVAVEYIISVFRTPLEAKGMCVASIQDEVEDGVSYAQKYLQIGYRKIWYKLHTSPDSSRWP